jgi:hypothetical protein
VAASDRDAVPTGLHRQRGKAWLEEPKSGIVKGNLQVRLDADPLQDGSLTLHFHLGFSWSHVHSKTNRYLPSSSGQRAQGLADEKMLA